MTDTERRDIVERLRNHGPVASDYADMMCEAADEIEEQRQTFDLQWKANQRGIKAWQAAHPGNDLVWPDQANMVEWLCNEITRLRASQAKAVEENARYRHLLDECADELENTRNQSGLIADVRAALAEHGGQT